MDATKRLNATMKVRGVYRVECYRRGMIGKEPPIRVLGPVRNTLDLPHAMALILGDSADHVSSTSDLEVRNSSGSLIHTLTSMSSGPDHSTQKEVVMEWTDDAGVSRSDVDELNIKTPGGVKFSDVATLGFGNKPANEDWVYTYTLTISSADAGVQDAGLDLMLKLLTGASASHFSNGNTTLEVLDGGISLGTVGCDAGFPTDDGTDTTTHEFTAGDGTLNGDWDEQRVAAGGTNFYHDTTARGNKGAGDVWTYSFDITFSG